MTTRERWIVYPLLFLALATSLRDHLLPRGDLRADRIRCEHLQVKGPMGQVVLDAQMRGGDPRRATPRVQVEGLHFNRLDVDDLHSDRIVVDQAVCHKLNVLTPKGQNAVMLGYNPDLDCGFVSTGYSPRKPHQYMFTYGMHGFDRAPAVEPTAPQPPESPRPDDKHLSPAAGEGR